MTGNISKKIGMGQTGPQGIRGPMPHIKFRYDAATGNLYCETDGIFTADDYVGMRVESTEKLDELVEQGVVNVGVIYTVKDRVATNGYLVTGKVSELFLTGYAREDFGTDDDPGRMYLYAPQFSVPDAYVSSTDCIWVYDCSGQRILQMSYPYYGGYPDWAYLSTFGADSVDDEITLYVGELSKPMELEPEAIIFEDVERAMYHNGESWVEVMTTEHLGDIDKALDAILDLDSKLLGGDA